MIKGSEKRKANHPIESLIIDRWSPRAMTGESITSDELMRLFEAARWAPSSFNSQQWRALYARRETEHWPTFLGLLVEGNKTWAQNAAVLIVFISRKNFEYDGEPSITHSYDCGAAWENFALQGFSQGLVVHGMQGFDYDRARTNSRSRMTSGSKPWPPWANRARKNSFRKNCRKPKALTIVAN
jgi:nitroreductase